MKDDAYREFLANYSLSNTYYILEVLSSLNIHLKEKKIHTFLFLKRNATEHFKKVFTAINDLVSYQSKLVPILMDSFEIYKMAIKYNETIGKKLENLLLRLYIQFNPEVLNRVCYYSYFLHSETLIAVYCESSLRICSLRCD